MELPLNTDYHQESNEVNQYKKRAVYVGLVF